MIVTCGSSQSNHARLTTAAARKLGMDAVVVLSRDEHTRFQGNLLTVRLMGADVTIVDAGDHWDLEADALQVCDRLRGLGRTPHYVPVSGTTPLSCLGYVVGALELAEQMESRDLRPDVIYLPFGTGGIFTATLLTFRAIGLKTRHVGISVNRDSETCAQYLDRWWDALEQLLEIDRSIDRGDYAIFDEFVGREYGDATAEGLDAIVAMASTEGVLLDPVYSGKVFAGLRAHRERGLIAERATVVMLHSGGTPALFAYHQELAAHLGLEE